MTLNEIVYNIRNLPYGGFSTEDSDISNPQIEFIVNYLREVLIKQMFDKNKRDYSIVTQDLGYVPISLVDKSECLEIISDCDILRTVTKIPTPLDINNSVAITAVQTVDGSRSFSKTYLAAVKWHRYNRFTKNTSKWYYKNGYIYITEDEEMEFINIRGVFSDPRQAANYKNCDGKVCWSPDDEYPITGKMVSEITDKILRGEAAALIASSTDRKNDNVDNANLQNANVQERKRRTKER